MSKTFARTLVTAVLLSVINTAPAQLDGNDLDQDLISGSKALRSARSVSEPSNVAAHGYLKRFTFQSDVQTVKRTLLEALYGQGFQINNVTDFYAFLRGVDIDLASKYRGGDLIEFCDRRLLAVSIESSPHSVVLCPLSIAIYTLVANPGTTHVSFRRPMAPGAPVKIQQALIAVEARVEAAISETGG